ncbi:MAG: MBL fold metallo-hydrolase [Candidatus Omnitrophota bacterium]|jgi:7,8-dihydropterin-6-yl-methyl-4-(beta-D-ribofuranosyl)aminobenzene 5'-phosphate synthase
MRLTVLAEGSTKWQRFVKHWGLSILIGKDIIFDTFGKPNYALEQMKRLKVDLQSIKHIVISHDDWDHVGGLQKILEARPGAAAYICPHFKTDIKEMIRGCGANAFETRGLTGISDSCYLSGELKGKRRDSDIAEQYMAIRIDDGIAVVTGCAHPGIVEIVQHANSMFKSNVRVLIGGFHLKDHSEEDARGIVLKLKALGIRRVAPFHCTGRNAQNLFKKEFGDECVIPEEGQAIDI